MHQVEAPKPRPLPLLRRETAEKAAEKYNRDVLEKEEDALKCHDELVNLLEESMLAGEQRGIQIVLDFYKQHIDNLRKTFKSGPANHITQGVNTLLEWLNRTESLKLHPREEKESLIIKPDRKFIGMPKKE